MVPDTIVECSGNAAKLILDGESFHSDALLAYLGKTEDFHDLAEGVGCSSINGLAEYNKTYGAQKSYKYIKAGITVVMDGATIYSMGSGVMTAETGKAALLAAVRGIFPKGVKEWAIKGTVMAGTTYGDIFILNQGVDETLISQVTGFAPVWSSIVAIEDCFGNVEAAFVSKSELYDK